MIWKFLGIGALAFLALTFLAVGLIFYRAAKDAPVLDDDEMEM